MVTTRWKPSEPAFDVQGHPPVVCASYLHHTEQSLQATGNQSWQACIAYPDKPAGSISAQDKGSWHKLALRALSGCTDDQATDSATMRFQA